MMLNEEEEGRRRMEGEIFAKQFLETAQHIIYQTIEPSEEGQ